MSKSTKYSLLALIVIIVLGFGYVYMKGDDTKSNNSNMDDKTMQDNAKQEQILRRGNGTEIKTLDPNLASGQPEHRIISDLFEGLVVLDEKADILPGMAERWEISDDGKTYTFHLRKDAVWSNSTPVTAQDFVYAWQRLINPATATDYSFMLYLVKNAKAINTGEIKDLSQLGAKALDDKTLQVELIAPTPYFLQMLTHYSSYPLPRGVVEQYGDAWTRVENIVSNGAFKLVEWVPQARMVAIKSPTYYDRDKVKLDKVIYYPTEDQSSELKRYRAGEIDFTAEMPLEQLDWAKENLAGQLQQVPTLSTIYYGFNTTKAPFKDNLKLRQALTYAIDRDILVDKVVKTGVPAFTIVPPTINNYEGYVPEYAKWSKEEREAMAKKLYAEAGYSAENPLEIELLYNTAEINKKLSVSLAGMWQQVLGVKTTLTNQEWKVYLNNRREKNTQVFRAGWVGDYNDPNTFLDMWLPQSELNDVGFNNAKYVELIEKAALEKDLKKRAGILLEAEKIFTNDYAILPLYYKTHSFVVNKNLKGWAPNIMDTNLSKYMYFDNK